MVTLEATASVQAICDGGSIRVVFVEAMASDRMGSGVAKEKDERICWWNL